MANPINTAKVAGRRSLHFESLRDILADVDLLARAKEVQTLGNWSGGTICQHLALVMNKSIDGFESRLPWLLQKVVRLFLRNYLLNKPMAAGHQISPKATKELVQDSVSWQEGVDHLRKAIHRLESESKRATSPFMGDMTNDEWTKFHCRHAELHLSFLQPVS